MRRLLKLSICAGVVIAISACEKNKDQSSAETPATSTTKAASGIIESRLNYSTATTMEGIGSIKFKAGRLPATGGPKPGYVPKDLGDLTFEEVIYYIEATHNFDANKDAKWDSDHETRVFPFSLPFVTPGVSKVNQDEVVTAYDQLYHDIEINTPPDKEVFVVNVYGLEIGHLEGSFEMAVQYVPLGGGSTTTPLSAADNWKAFQGQGYCNGGGSGDASSRLESLINWYGIAGWNGSSSTSTGGMALVCAASGWPQTFTDVEWLPSSTTYHQNGSATQWPLTHCSLSHCLNQTQMENNLVSFFNYTNNTLLTGSYADYTMLSCVYDNGTAPAPFAGYCYQNGGGIQYRHYVRWKVGIPHCATPW